MLERGVNTNAALEVLLRVRVGMSYQCAPNYCLRCCVIVFVSNFTFHYIHQPDPRTIMSLISLTGQHSLSEYDILVIASRAIVAGRIRMYDYPFGA